jgi:pimeloyl-ACP methyl ester carboxylesterase
MTVERIATDLGTLHVETMGAGPPVVLWHSLFLDSRSWCGIAEELAGSRSVVAIDGPSHGRSEPIGRDFSFADCVGAAEAVLDALGIAEPVDWVGNAWGGHVGIQLAVHRPERLRTLTTIGTPAHALRASERWTKVWPLVQLYRFTGPNALLLKPLADALVGRESYSAAPALADEVMSAFTRADRPSMFRAMRSMMLNRPDMAADSARIAAPVLMMAGRDDITGWRPAEAKAVADGMADATVVGVRGSGHSSPLLIDREAVIAGMQRFWSGARAG